MNSSHFSSDSVGNVLQEAADFIAPLVAWAITAAELALWLGRRLRLAVDDYNDQLACWWVSVLGLADPVPVAVPCPTRSLAGGTTTDAMEPRERCAGAPMAPVARRHRKRTPQAHAA